MGAATFINARVCDPSKVNISKAFWETVEQSRWEHGNGGYTGTIAEKDSFLVINPIMRAIPTMVEAKKIADKLIEADDHRISDKWGPAGAIRCQDGYVFFGWASS